MEELIFPSRCIFCRDILPFGNKDYICEKCAENIEEISGNVCLKCGRPVRYHGLCRQCSSAKHTFEGGYALYLYKDEVRSAIHRFKYGRRGSYARYFGRAMAIYADYIEIPYVDYVVPVPVHSSRLRHRGFNQSRLLAEIYAAERDEILGDVLQRVKHTKAQSGLTKTQRMLNVRGAFRSTEDVRGKTILLIDDIFTTGSTVDECTRVLKRAGAKEVYVFCLAVRELD